MISARSRRFLAAMGVAGLQRGLQAGVTLITLPLILHALGTARFGLWAAATSLSWLGAMLDLGLGAALITLVAQAAAAKDFAQMRDALAASLIGAMLMTGAIALVGGALVWMAAAGAARAAFLIAVVALAVTVPLSLANMVWLGLQKGAVAGFWNIVQTVLNLGGLLAALAFKGGLLWLVAAFYGSTLLALALSLLHLLRAHPELRPARGLPPASSWQLVLPRSSLLAAMSVAAGGAYALDNVLALALLGPVAAARIAILLRIGVTITGLISALTQPLWPGFADAYCMRDFAWARRSLGLGTAGLAAGILLGGAAMVLLGPAFLRAWLHEDLGVGRGLVLAIVVWVFGLAVPSVAGLLMNAMSILKFQLAAICIASAAALLLKYLLAADYGVGGIFLAAPVSWVLVIWPSYAWRLRVVLRGWQG
jgi:O-antigen/teichoic acid export membrane protein